MSVWAYLAIGFCALALIETVFVIVFTGIPLWRDKRKERKSREQVQR